MLVPPRGLPPPECVVPHRATGVKDLLEGFGLLSGDAQPIVVPHGHRTHVRKHNTLLSQSGPNGPAGLSLSALKDGVSCPEIFDEIRYRLILGVGAIAIALELVGKLKSTGLDDPAVHVDMHRIGMELIE